MSGPRVPPHNLEAERSLIGAALLSSAAMDVLTTDVEPEDFYGPGHQVIAAVLGDLHRGGLRNIDPVILADELDVRGHLDTVGGTPALVDIVSAVPSTTSAPGYARIIVETATLRRTIAAAAEIVEDAYRHPGDVAGFVDAARTSLSNVSLPVHTGAPSPGVFEFLDVHDPEPDWIVPGLIERTDRLILTAGEGVGKSTLLRQFAVTIASGMHPFTGTPMQPHSVLLCDLENSPAQIRRKLAPLADIAGRHLTGDRLRIESRLDGIDLLSRHDKNWLLERVAANRPDVLVIGPIYKMHAGNPNDEEPARVVIGVLDMIRAKYGCTLLIEAHAPHAAPGARRPLRPMGASIWMRWPEFGYGMREELDEDREPTGAVRLEAWRGAREERTWPGRLSRNLEGHWPWRDSAYMPERYREPPPREPVVHEPAANRGPDPYGRYDDPEPF